MVAMFFYMVFVAAKSIFVLRLAFDVRIFRHVDTGLRKVMTGRGKGFRVSWAFFGSVNSSLLFYIFLVLCAVFYRG